MLPYVAIHVRLMGLVYIASESPDHQSNVQRMPLLVWLESLLSEFINGLLDSKMGGVSLAVGIPFVFSLLLCLQAEI